jgi:hypothetical protein
LLRFGALPTGTTATCFIVVASITDTESSAELETKSRSLSGVNEIQFGMALIGGCPDFSRCGAVTLG